VHLARFCARFPYSELICVYVHTWNEKVYLFVHNFSAKQNDTDLTVPFGCRGKKTPRPQAALSAASSLQQL
jgi:hypothetical protein